MSFVKPAVGKNPKVRRSAFTRIVALTVVPGIAASLALAGGVSATAAPLAQEPTPLTQVKKAATVSHSNELSPAVQKLMKGKGTAAEQKALTSYWSSSRMKAAKSLDSAGTFKKDGKAPRQASKELSESPAQGPAQSVAPSKTAKAPKAVKTGSTIELQADFPNYPSYYPVARTNGKVFFSRSGRNYVCSASIVNSEGKSLVWTAGHCLVDYKAWSYNVAFVPSYNNGSRPYGTWYSKQITTTYAWYQNRDFRHDTGAATMYRNFGYRIADYLGAQGITWNQSANYYTCAFGYPAASPYNGERLVRACGNTGNPGNGTIYMYSGMTGGSSGGPWLRSFDGNWGWVNGHNDFIYTSSPQWMYSPYYGNEEGSLYNAVRYQTS